jgi:hypothetical protein
MFRANTSICMGDGVTRARALMGIARFLVNDSDFDVPDKQITVKIAEYDPVELFSDGDPDPYDDIEEWGRDVEEVTLEPDSIRRLGRLEEQIESEFGAATGEDDWRIDYDDEDITYVVRSETGTVVGIEEHWDRAKEARDKCNEGWDDGQEYWIDEIEGEPKFTFTEVDE